MILPFILLASLAQPVPAGAKVPRLAQAPNPAGGGMGALPIWHGWYERRTRNVQHPWRWARWCGSHDGYTQHSANDTLRARSGVDDNLSH